jgi:hypothetical protein
MSGGEQVAENYLVKLRAGAFVETRFQGFPTLLFHAGFAVDLPDSTRVLASKLSTLTPPVILLSEERQFLHHVGAFDLALSETLENGDPYYFEGVIGIKEIFLDEHGGGFLQLVQDVFLASLVKRLGAPIAAIRLAVPPDHQEKDEFAQSRNQSIYDLP